MTAERHIAPHPPRFQRIFDSRISALEQVMQETEEFLEAHATKPQLIHAVRMALEELATNIIKYANPDSPCHPIEMRLELGSPAVLTLKDQGAPFNPLTDAPAPTLDGPIEERPIGGLGLHMIQALGMKLDYHRDEPFNILQVTIPCE